MCVLTTSMRDHRWMHTSSIRGVYIENINIYIFYCIFIQMHLLKKYQKIYWKFFSKNILKYIFMQWLHASSIRGVYIENICIFYYIFVYITNVLKISTHGELIVFSIRKIYCTYARNLLKKYQKIYWKFVYIFLMYCKLVHMGN